MDSTSAPSQVGALEQLKEEDERLYRKIIRHHSSLARDREGRKAIVGEANDFVARLTEAPARLGAVSVDDYNWLNETALRWEVIYSSIFNIPKEISITVSPEQLERPAQTRVFTNVEVEKWLGDKAYELSRIRKVNYLLREVDALQKRMPSTPEEMEQDWRNAQVEFASQVLDGKINFVKQIASNSYRRLEEVWLQEVKQLRAFIIWEGRGCPWSDDGGVADYFRACEQMRDLLVDPGIKGRLPDDFAEAKSYLELNYLDKGGRLDPEKPGTQSLLKSKAAQALRRCGPPDRALSLRAAEVYARQFYEHITPAVTAKDREATLLVLKAFQLSEASPTPCAIANCFEAALAIYFLDPEVIRALWQESEGQPWPETWAATAVRLPSSRAWADAPEEVRDRLEVDYARGMLAFKGAMSERQKVALLSEARGAEEREAVEELFGRSRLLPREATL